MKYIQAVRIFLVLLVSWALFAPVASAQIYNIDKFLELCPTEDPRFDQFANDFSILKGGVEINQFPCQGPISELPIEQYTDELIILQGIRTMFYMDRNQSGHLAWTSKSTYDWMRDSVDGFNILSGPGSGGSCCTVINGLRYINLYETDESGRDADRNWENISSNISFYIHEARHVEGPHHPTTTSAPNCACDNPQACDLDYDESNLGSYGASYFFRKLLNSGVINVGLANLSSQRRIQIAQSNLITINNSVASRFCQSPPSKLDLPAQPGGGLAIGEDVQEIFWGIETLRPEYFSGGSELRSADGYIYRYFDSSGIYVGLFNDDLYAVGGDFGNEVIRVGTVPEVLTVVRTLLSSQM